MKLWNDVFDENTIWAQDCFGTWIYKDDFNHAESNRKRPNGDGEYYHYGWNVDHIKPISVGEKKIIGITLNRCILEITNLKANSSILKLVMYHIKLLNVN